MSREASHNVILSGMVGVDVPSLQNFLEILLGLGPEFDSNDAGGCSPPCECFYISSRHTVNTTPYLMPPKMSLTSHVAYLKVKAECL